MRGPTYRGSIMIIDASVAVPWLIETPFSSSARKLRREINRSPCLVLIEASSSLLKYVRAGHLERPDVHAAMTALPVALNELVEDAKLLPSAIDIAVSLPHKIYDCLYLSLALERRE